MHNRGTSKSRYFISIVSVIAAISVLGLVFTQTAFYKNVAQSTAQPTSINSNLTPVKPDATPVVVNTPVISTPGVLGAMVEQMVPYSRSSIWNTPIGSSPKYDPYSEQMIANLAHVNDGEILTPDTFNYPVYFADANTPRWDIPCTKYKCSMITPEGVIRTDMLEDVPIPQGAQPAPDSDGRMIIIDRTTYAEYDIWQAQWLGSGWTASNVSSYNILLDGTPPTHSSRGAGVPSYAGLIRPWEILQGKIEHALAFGVDHPAEDRCVYPASKTDGDSNDQYAIPEGARLQLDPSLTEEDFDEWGLNETGKIIARAMQEYGMILVDHSGSFKLYLEDLTVNPFETREWTDPDLNLTKETVSEIPHTSFRVLELPPAYWSPTGDDQMHGHCFTYPGLP
jgi:hypothetical protein